MKNSSFYENDLDKTKSTLVSLRKQMLINSLLRLISFVSIFATFFLLYPVNLLLAIIGTILVVGVFLWLIKKHLRLQTQKTYYIRRERIVQNELKALRFDFSEFGAGQKFADPKHNYSYDLDIFGKGSIHQMLNRTITQWGETILANELNLPETNKKKLYAKQDCIAELASDPEFLLHFRSMGKEANSSEEDRERLLRWLGTKSFITKRRGAKLMLYALPTLAFGILLASIVMPGLTPLFTIMFLFNLGVIGRDIRKINQEHNSVSSLLAMLKKYQGLLELIENKNYSNDLWKSQIGSSNMKVSPSYNLKRLTKMVGAFDNRLNFLMAIALEGFLLWDYLCLYRIEQWKNKHTEELQGWLYKVALTDSLVSGAVYAFNNPSYTYPKFSDSRVYIAKKLGHPLINDKVRVYNDFSVEKAGDFTIVTGANMAGKSTFLRTVGVAQVLSLAGLPVCAEELTVKPMMLYTSMRTNDSLAENESYFYAELLRLKNLLKTLEKTELFIILDEILKGTNSVDKQQGSYKALQKIIERKGTGIIATHDLALTQIQQEYPQKVQNKCFEIEIDQAKIFFDYKLYNGVTQKMNAMLLLEQMGIV